MKRMLMAAVVLATGRVDSGRIGPVRHGKAQSGRVIRRGRRIAAGLMAGWRAWQRLNHHSVGAKTSPLEAARREFEHHPGA